MDKYFTTRKLIGSKKSETWREFISETFVELDCKNMNSNSFFGEMRARTAGELGLTTITTDAYDVFRSRKRISVSDADAFIFSIQMSGSATIRQLGREVTLQAGDFTMYDATNPYELHFSERLTQLVVMIPRKHLKTYMDSPESLTALHVKGGRGLAKIATNFAATLFHQTNSLTPAHQDNMADTLVSLLSLALRKVTADTKRAPRNRETQLLWVKQYIAKNLRDSTLSLKDIATAHQITERYLHMLFKGENITPNRYIWQERLKSAHSDLSNALLSHRSISNICYAWGFNDTAHFSRSFKARYGLSPRAFRTKELGGFKI